MHSQRHDPSLRVRCCSHCRRVDCVSVGANISEPDIARSGTALEGHWWYYSGSWSDWSLSRTHLLPKSSSGSVRA